MVWASLVGILATVVVVGLSRRMANDEPPVLAVLPAFALVERSGRPLTHADLAGRIWIADFVFTRCGGLCPMLSTRMAALRRTLDEGGLGAVTTISISVDPERDDPSALRSYAERYTADPDRWLFATGDRDVVERLVREGFRLSIAALPAGDRAAAVEPITHSDRFVLVDGAGQIRGYYHALDAEALARLEADVRRLAVPGA